jgi:hypothetical protein
MAIPTARAPAGLTGTRGQAVGHVRRSASPTGSGIDNLSRSY